MKFRALAMLFIGTILISSCTVQKRKHLSGWNLQWKGKVEKPHKVKKLRTETFVFHDTTDNTSSQNTRPANTDMALASVDNDINLGPIITTDTTKKKAGKSHAYVTEDLTLAEEKKTDWLGLTGFIVLIIGLLSIFPIPIAMFLGAFSMRANKKKQDAYKGRWLGKVAFWVSFVLMAAAVPLFVLAAVFGGTEMLVVAGIILMLDLLALKIAHPKSK